MVFRTYDTGQIIVDPTFSAVYPRNSLLSHAPPHVLSTFPKRKNSSKHFKDDKSDPKTLQSPTTYISRPFPRTEVNEKPKKGLTFRVLVQRWVYSRTPGSPGGRDEDSRTLWRLVVEPPTLMEEQVTEKKRKSRSE